MHLLLALLIHSPARKHYNIQCTKTMLVQPKTLAHDPLDAITVYRTPDRFLGYGQPQARA